MIKLIDEAVLNLKECNLCPRKCKVDRTLGQRGFCGCTDEIYVARAALHMWEEPCISGEEGSGAIFFSGCSLRCVFCQNFNISNCSVGKKISVERLADICLELQEKGANNINLVTPTHYVTQIIEALTLAKKNGLRIPIVYNTGGYENEETIEALNGLVDVYLPDLKYYDDELAKKYSNAPHYFETAIKAIAKMFEQTGPCRFDENGKIIRGVIVRHLILPGNIKDSKKVVDYLHETYGDNIYLSIMSQYTPMKEFVKSGKYPELSKKLPPKAYDKFIDYCIEKGIENAFIQEGDPADESFIPDFDYEGV